MGLVWSAKRTDRPRHCVVLTLPCIAYLSGGNDNRERAHTLPYVCPLGIKRTGGHANVLVISTCLPSNGVSINGMSMSDGRWTMAMGISTLWPQLVPARPS